MANAQDDETFGEKRAMRNALIRFGRSGIRNALIRFGKRMSHMYFLDAENKRTVVLNPSMPYFVENLFKIVLGALSVLTAHTNKNVQQTQLKQDRAEKRGVG